MIRALAVAVALILPAGAGGAEVRPDTQTLLEAMQVPDLVEVLRDEGLQAAKDIEAGLFPGRGGAAWSRQIEQVYDPGQMYDTFAEAFDDAIDPDAIAPLTDFFTSERGRAIASLEVSARRALLDPALDAAATDAYLARRDEGDARLRQIERFVEVNGLVEENVMGIMNSNFAFYMGLIGAGGLEREVTESEVLADVWSREDQIRADSSEWVHSYLLLAYEPLSPDDLDTYIALSQTDEGRALNRALFTAFGELFTGLSRDVGALAARFMSGSDI